MEEFCYICYEEDSPKNKLLKPDICLCKTNRLHVKCFRKLSNLEICSICKGNFRIKILKRPRIIRRRIENGLFEEYQINRRNRKSGLYRCYYPNGLLAIQCEFSNGLRHGEYKYYYSDGEMRDFAYFYKGVVIESYHWEPKSPEINYSELFPVFNWFCFISLYFYFLLR